MQACTRNEVSAAVHRVVCAVSEDTRISAPILLRERSGMKMDVEKNTFVLEKKVGDCLSLNVMA